MALLLFACAPGLSACGETNDQRDVRRIVSRYYEALKRHDARTACGLVSPAVGTGAAGGRAGGAAARTPGRCRRGRALGSRAGATASVSGRSRPEPWP